MMRKSHLYKKLSYRELLESFTRENDRDASRILQFHRFEPQENFGLNSQELVDSILACDDFITGLRKSKVGPYEVAGSKVKANKFAGFLMPPPDSGALKVLRSLNGFLPPSAEFYLHCLESSGIQHADFQSVGDGDGVQFAEKVNKFYEYGKGVLESSHSYRQFLTVSDLAKENYQRSSSWIEREVKRMGAVIVTGYDLWLPGRCLDQQRFVLSDTSKRIESFQSVVDGLSSVVMIPQFHCSYGLGWHIYFLISPSGNKPSLAHRNMLETWESIVRGPGVVFSSECHPNIFKVLGNVSIHGADGFYSFFSSLSYLTKLGELFPTGIKPVIKSFRPERENYYRREESCYE